MINKLLYEILVSIIHGKTLKKLYKNNRFKLPGPTREDSFELPNGSYSVLEIRDYFNEIIIKNKKKKKQKERKKERKSY